MTVPRENFINLINIFWYLTVSHCRVVALSFVALTLKIVPSPAHDLRLTCDHNFRVYKHIFKYFEPFLDKIKKKSLLALHGWGALALKANYRFWSQHTIRGSFTLYLFSLVTSQNIKSQFKIWPCFFISYMQN